MMRNKAHTCQIEEAITAHSAESWLLSFKSSIPLNVKSNFPILFPKQTVTIPCTNQIGQTDIFRIISIDMTKTLSHLNYRLLKAIIRRFSEDDVAFGDDDEYYIKRCIIAISCQMHVLLKQG